MGPRGEERRPDPTTDSPKAYTHAQFVEFYGPHRGENLWNRAGRLADEGMPRRRDPTNPPHVTTTYTRREFIEFYGPRRGVQLFRQAEGPADKPQLSKKALGQSITLGYWAIRGLAAPLRMMCAWAGAEPQEKRYATVDEWFKGDKLELIKKNPLINLPYVITRKDGEQVITQSTACLMHLGRYLGFDEDVSPRNDQALCQVFDLRNDTMEIVYPFKGVAKTSAEVPAAYQKKQKDFIKHFTKLEGLIRAGGYMGGRRPSSADFHLWEMIDEHERLASDAGVPSCLAELPKCKALHEKMRNEKRLAKYFDGEAFQLPFNNPGFAVWIGEPQKKPEASPKAAAGSPKAAEGSPKAAAK